MPNTTVPAAATGLPIPHHIRSAISAEIERLIYLLDLLDGDIDLEEGGDSEPWLAGPQGGHVSTMDLEHDDGEAGIADREGLWEQGHVPGLGLELLWEEAQATRETSARLGAIIARLSGIPAVSA